jgi:integrase
MVCPSVRTLERSDGCERRVGVQDGGGHDQKGGLVYRRTLLATLVFSGLRIGELTALRWRDVDLAGNRLTIGASKTDAGMRQIDLLPVLRNELTTYKAQAPNTDPPLPEGLTLHALRRTCASVLVALGKDPRYVMAQLGHTDPTVTLGIYAQAMTSSDADRERLRLLVEGGDLAGDQRGSAALIPA